MTCPAPANCAYGRAVKTRGYSFKLDPELLARLRAFARSNGLSASENIRRAIEERLIRRGFGPTEFGPTVLRHRGDLQRAVKEIRAAATLEQAIDLAVVFTRRPGGGR